MSPTRSLALVALVALAPCTALKAAMVYYVPFDDGTNPSLTNYGTAGGSVNQSSGPYGASAPTTVNTTVAPTIGSAYSENFTSTPGDNRGGAISLPNSTSQFRLDQTSSRMTISTWINTSGSFLRGIANTLSSSQTNGWALGVAADGKLQFTYNNAGGGSNRSTVASVIPDNTWVNVVATWDSSSDNALRFYVNGVNYVDNVQYTGPGVLVTGPQDVALGVFNHDGAPGSATSNIGGYGSLNGNMDDAALWDTILTVGEIKSLTSAPSLLNGYNAGIMNSLFAAYESQGSQTVGALNWNYQAGFDVTGHALGDTWLGGSGDYYLWLGGDSSNPLGLVTAVPEPGISTLLLGAGCVLFGTRRFRKVRVVA